MTNITKAELFKDVCVLFSGRMAKMKKRGAEHMDSGAIEDLSQASINIYAAITSLGMDKELGFVNIESIALMDNYFLSQQIEKRFLHWVSVAQDYTKKLVDEQWELIETLALKLIEKEIVESDELATIVGDTKVVFTIPESL
jgi:ATP-dependent Zn protease